MVRELGKKLNAEVNGLQGPRLIPENRGGVDKSKEGTGPEKKEFPLHNEVYDKVLNRLELSSASDGNNKAQIRVEIPQRHQPQHRLARILARLRKVYNVIYSFATNSISGAKSDKAGRSVRYFLRAFLQKAGIPESPSAGIA